MLYTKVRDKQILLIINKDFSNLGCLFHFGQCIWRNIQSHGLQNKYQADKSFYLNIKKLIALSFVPISDVIKAFELIVDDFDDDAEPFLDYFEKPGLVNEKEEVTILYAEKNKLNFF